MNTFSKIYWAAICFLLGTVICSAQSAINNFELKKQDTTEGYQQYVGKTAIFYEPVREIEEQFNLKKISFGVPYTIQSIVLEGDKVTLQVLAQNTPKAKPVKLVCLNGWGHTWGSGVRAGVENIPLYILEDLIEAKNKYVGTPIMIDGEEYRISDIVMRREKSILDSVFMYSCFEYENVKTGEKRTETMCDAIKGHYHSSLSRVEKPADESVRYGETTTIDEEGITKYSYVDNIIDIIIFGTDEKFHFVLKNISENSIKLVWNEAVFVGIDGTTSKVMHQGIKYSQRDGDQPASVIIRNAKLSDVAVPTENVEYGEYIKDWYIKSMYPSKRGNDGQVTLMLPIQIKDTINEYIFVFDVKYEWDHPELHEEDL